MGEKTEEYVKRIFENYKKITGNLNQEAAGFLTLAHVVLDLKKVIESK